MTLCEQENITLLSPFCFRRDQYCPFSNDFMMICSSRKQKEKQKELFKKAKFEKSAMRTQQLSSPTPETTGTNTESHCWRNLVGLDPATIERVYDKSYNLSHYSIKPGTENWSCCCFTQNQLSLLYSIPYQN